MIYNGQKQSKTRFVAKQQESGTRNTGKLIPRRVDCSWLGQYNNCTTLRKVVVKSFSQLMLMSYLSSGSKILLMSTKQYIDLMWLCSCFRCFVSKMNAGWKVVVRRLHVFMQSYDKCWHSPPNLCDLNCILLSSLRANLIGNPKFSTSSFFLCLWGGNLHSYLLSRLWIES